MGSFDMYHGLAARMDADDALAHFRSCFHIASEDEIYLLGNSLGRMPKATAKVMKQAVEHQWGKQLIGGWNDGWWQAPERIGDKIGELIGAQRGEVILAESTSVNLFKLLVAVMQTAGASRRIVFDNTNFPTDCYIAQGAAALLSPSPEVVRVDLSEPGDSPVPEALLEAFRTRPTVAILSHVAFRSGYRLDVGAVNAAARQNNVRVIWDFSHSVGAVPIDVKRDGVELGVGCTYKYLNGGPGAPAWLYVTKELQAILRNPISGWFGQRDPFQMAYEYEPVEGIRRFLSGSTPVLSTLAVEPGVDLTLEAGTDRLWMKAQNLLNFLRDIISAELAEHGFEIVTPRHSHGSHLSLRHPEADVIVPALKERSVICDYRPPGLIRMAVAPLYTRYGDIVEAAERLGEVMVSGSLRSSGQHRGVVT